MTDRTGPGIEATISQGVRTKGLRQARYRGQDKVHLQHLQIATALNLVRIDSWLLAQKKGRPARGTDCYPQL